MDLYWVDYLASLMVDLTAGMSEQTKAVQLVVWMVVEMVVCLVARMADKMVALMAA